MGTTLVSVRISELESGLEPGKPICGDTDRECIWFGKIAFVIRPAARELNGPSEGENDDPEEEDDSDR
jgi:hypothetical protein